jgi:hypothetical protein
VLADGIAWRPALSAALLFAVPTGVLCFGMPPVGLIAMIGAAVWAVGLYVRRARPLRFSSGAGAQIGLVTGLFASWLTAALIGGGLWISRFVEHKGGQFDSVWSSFALNYHQRMLEQVSNSDQQSIHMADQMYGFLISVDGPAAFGLLLLLLVMVVMVSLGTLGGALGARLAMPRRTSI